MLASRCGYVCRTCRAKTERLIYHQQRRKWSDVREFSVGKHVEKASNRTEETTRHEAPSSRQEDATAVWSRPLIRRHATMTGKPLIRKSGGPPPTKIAYSVFPPTKAGKGRLASTAEDAEEVMIVYHKGQSKGLPDSEMQLECLIDLHTQRAGRGRLIIDGGKSSGGAGGAGGANAASLDDFTAAVEEAAASAEAKADTERHYAQRTPPRSSPPTTPLLSRATPAQRQQPASTPTFAWRSASMSTLVHNLPHFHGLHARMLHTYTSRPQHSELAGEAHSLLDGSTPLHQSPNATGGIRAQLRRWEEVHGEDEDPTPLIPQDDAQMNDAPYNDFSRLPDEARIRIQAQKDQLEMEQDTTAAYVAASGKEGYDGSTAVEDARFLVPGDLVELQFTSTEREPLLAVFIRPVGVTGNYAQFFSVQGKWLHQSERSVQYSVKGFADTKTLDKIIPYLPTPETMADIQALADRAFAEDLSVPREVTAPLIARMVKFHDESQEVYRLHANSLDNAHEILAHDTDLWYGTLVSAASTLLEISAPNLSPAAVYAVRKALVRAGFAFNVDRRSHRQTGFFQIRSKAQVKNVEQVRHWVRQWQEDLAKTAGLSKQASRHRIQTRGAQHVYSFIEKAKTIAMESRKTRQPTESNNIGISKTRIALTDDTDCVKITTGNEFTNEEVEILRFMEAWACTNLFMGLPRIESLPPLILHATGLYPELPLNPAVGFMFLQELGTLLPYENRVRFDQHLLLPSSQHSKPLQNLMAKLIQMRHSHNFQDSMAGLRHDWKDLPVYCIDSADAQEIDDGISIEPAGKGANGKNQHWVHIHIANPTAFFDRNHPLAKMARHMGESIYMPERTYMMLPRWATQQHFSLAPNRPCLTFSAKLDSEGKTVEQKITPGTIRNVVSLTPDDIESLIGDNSLETNLPMKTYFVGGTPPPSRDRKSPLSGLREHNITELRTLHALAECRAGIRKSAGGLFFDSHVPEVKVWQSNKHSGLAWDHPYRFGSRRVEGDPIIQLKTRGLSNWFSPTVTVVDVLVREFMLLACEISASWCAERHIPIIYRGTTDSMHSERQRERFVKEQIAPNMSADGTYPMWLGLQYLRTIGFTALRTEPLRHGFLGMEHYSKVTSPLRRYGDMILHWQIEAALRYEARTGESLVFDKRAAVEPIKKVALPFSKAALRSIMLGLQPREQMVARAQSYADTFWVTMFLFRKHHYGEDGGFEGFPTRELPVKVVLQKRDSSKVGAPKEKEEFRMKKVPIFKAFVSNRPDTHYGAPYISCFLVEFNVAASMIPQKGGEEVKLGDIWECRIEKVDLFKRMAIVRAVQLVGREAL